jgi:DNA sulfur modification protein DndE
MPTNTAWIAGRTYTNGTMADTKIADIIQHEYKLTPLSSFDHPNIPYIPPTNLPVNPAIDESTPPVNQVANMSAGTFFGTLAAMMGTSLPLTNPPLPADAATVAKFAAIGLVPGKPFDISMLPRRTVAALELAARAGERIVSSDAALLREFGRPVNGWTWSTILGQYGTEYLKRAIVANRALGANLAVDAVYFYAQQDGRGALLDGNKQYTLTFPAGQLPPVSPSAFWSVTLYNTKGALVGPADNLGSTQINAGLQPNKGGAYQFFIQATEPTDPAQVPYWIQAPAGQKFLLLLRAYMPSSQILNNQYAPPPVVRTLVPPGPLTPSMRRQQRTPFLPRRLGSVVVPN